MNRHNAECLIFTGAGASKPLGYPTTEEFFRGEGGSIYNQLTAYLKRNIVDVEEAFELLTPILTFKETPAGSFLQFLIQNDAMTKIKEFIEAAKKKCFYHYGRQPKQDEVENLYIPLFEAINFNNKVVDFFTTNYDPVTDWILKIVEEKYRASYTDGFSEKLNEWKPDLYENDSHFRLFRLHGSMAYKKQGSIIRNTRDYDLGSDIENHVLIYPGYKKDPSLEPEIVSIPHRELQNSLKTIRWAIFIGFAFRDANINNAIEDAIRINKEIKIIIVNPMEPKQLKRNISNKLENYTHIQLPFGDANAIIKIKEEIQKT